MADFAVDPERINVFPIDEAYLFKHYFERSDLFEALRDYYDDDAYRFEIPADAFDRVRERLADEYYDLVVVDDPEPYCVVKEQYTPHADILRNAVVSWERRGQRFFLLKDDLAVRQALEQGAERVAETPYALGI